MSEPTDRQYREAARRYCGDNETRPCVLLCDPENPTQFMPVDRESSGIPDLDGAWVEIGFFVKANEALQIPDLARVED